ncbi:Ubiquitin carboxyl-terminal hydrolase calypso [Trichinella pseudospiralis]|uniref:Ubiquitin carboxyl-terminal hydrolase n=1 Tax=Trichinella pseudospiralis TaxID=6337 RepID=A0A0V1FSH9_TRIPS|nr:Ubiquitin carboxyl-terminal hydrolase calypso [Trichinella pseudospiralis]KRY89003.1 Ubiquitin carboxyl-terminal hydrolase calypso [Trichinella pseudospiralis]
MQKQSEEESWAELESDPGLFTLLIEDFGVSGVAVEEIYDLQSPLNRRTYGFIFLFKWLGEHRRARRQLWDFSTQSEHNVANHRLFFAKQKVSNSCATYALLNILLNLNDIAIGPLLKNIKESTNGLDPESSGIIVANTAELARCHNKHARPDAVRELNKQTNGPVRRSVVYSSSKQARFHFSSYIQFDGHLYELDSLKDFPIDLGEISANTAWTDYFQKIVLERFSKSNVHSNEIRYNLMAVIPCPIMEAEEKLRIFKANVQMLTQILEKFVGSKLTTDKKLGVDERRRRLLLFCESSFKSTKCKDSKCSCNSTPNGINIEQVLSQSVVNNWFFQRNRKFINLKLTVSSSQMVVFKVCITKLIALLNYVDSGIAQVKMEINELKERKEQFLVDDARRVHDYEPFIRTFLTAMAEKK